MTWRESKEVALAATLLAVLLMLLSQIQYYIRHSGG